MRLGERGRLCSPPSGRIKYILGTEYLHSTWVPDAASFSSSWVNNRCVYPRIFKIFQRSENNFPPYI